MELSRPFIRLPFSFDADTLASEVASIPANAWMAHPSRMRGNSAVALISRDGGDNDDFEGRMQPTPHLRSCPYTEQVMGSFGEVLARSRLMRLAPGCEVQMHVDFNYHWYTRVRIHVPIVTDPRVIFHCGEERVNMQPGECWIFDSWRRHRVVNAGDSDRVHLVVDLSGSSRFWQLVRQAEGLPDSVEAKFIPFDPACQVTLLTEQYNTAPVMAPGEVDALVRELVLDFSSHPDNDPLLVQRYTLLLGDFCKDWRQVWLQHGYEPAGSARYRALIESLRSQLHADPRALITGSNQVGVNPIIVQRILRPALAPEHADQFNGGGWQASIRSAPRTEAAQDGHE
jgi:quercetin dioxygenase-like cupin family protein